MTETLREVFPGLWVSDIESAAVVGADFDLVVDCTGEGPTKGNGKTASLRPRGKTNHDWTEEQLTRIAKGVAKRIRKGETVLIHCRRGVSRSTVAAAAVLMRLGQAQTTREAVAKARWDGHNPASMSMGSLNRWWKAHLAERQQRLPLGK